MSDREKVLALEDVQGVIWHSCYVTSVSRKYFIVYEVENVTTG